MTIRLLAASLALFWGALDALTSSLIIPCHAPHFQYLEGLIRSYEAQTRPPDEVLVALSGCSEIEPEALQAIQEQTFAFPVRFICNDGPVSRGANRNLAAGQASGDILICQDADDIPHPSRIELCMQIFERRPEINFVLHGCALSPESKLPKVAYALQVPLEEFLGYPTHVQPLPAYDYPKTKLPKQHHCFCNGVPFLKRSIWESGTRWIESLQRTEDTRYIRVMVARHGGGVFLDLPLYFYRRDLSAGYSGRSVWERRLNS